MITVRIATKEDAALIAELSRQTFYETFAAQNTEENMELFMNGVFSKQVLMEEVGAPGSIFLLAHKGEEPVGYTRLRENNNPPELENCQALEIARIYAIRKSIGQGVGSALMQQCIEIARKQNLDTLWLGVFQENKRAIEFYTRWGFEKFASHIFMLGNDPQLDWLMKKKLDR